MIVFVKLLILVRWFCQCRGNCPRSEGMIKEAEELAAIAPNITVKVPMTPDGLKAVAFPFRKGIKTNVTLIFSANQALLAARAGAHMYLLSLAV